MYTHAMSSNRERPLKAVFQLRVFHTYVHARKTLNTFNITFEMNSCLHRENSTFPTS